MDRATYILQRAQQEYDEYMALKVIKSSDAIRSLRDFIKKREESDPLINSSHNTFTRYYSSPPPFLILPSFLTNRRDKEERKMQKQSKLIEKEIAKEYNRLYRQKQTYLFGNRSCYNAFNQIGYDKYEIDKLFNALIIAHHPSNDKLVSPSVVHQCILKEAWNILRFAQQSLAQLPSDTYHSLFRHFLLINSVSRIFQAPYSSSGFQDIYKHLIQLWELPTFQQIFRGAAASWYKHNTYPVRESVVL